MISYFLHFFLQAYDLRPSKQRQRLCTGPLPRHIHQGIAFSFGSHHNFHLGPITIILTLGEDASFLDLYSCTDACEVQGEASGTRTFFRRGKNHLELTGMHARNWFWVRRSIYLIPTSHWDPVHQSFSSYPLPYLCGGNNALASSNTHISTKLGINCIVCPICVQVDKCGKDQWRSFW